MSDTKSLSFGVLVSELDRKRSLAATHQDYPLDLLVPQLVAAQAAATPDAVSVASRHEVLTYAALEAGSNQIAHCLRSSGVGPEALVGVCLARTFDMVIATLGVLKSGAAYLPLDPAEPAERLIFKLNDARARSLLTTHRFAERLPSCKWPVIKLDLDGPQISSYPISPLDTAVTAKNLAYVIYTSGSTGQPKGVEIAHSSLLNLVLWHQRTFSVSPDDRASQLSALGFDAAVWEVWPYLTAGASVHLPTGVDVNDPEALRDWLISQDITIGFLPTPLAERVMMLEWPEKTALRVMLTGADTLHHYPSKRLPFRLVNNYGPTECTVVSTSGTVLPEECADRLPPIGRPIANTEIYILNERMQPVPIGEPGEIYIKGAGVARGYCNRPDLTAERFVPDPFSSEPGGRLYKTGDLGRYLSDGQIGFLGRIDEQVKIRGFRIEPAEIVHVLNQHPAIRASAVLAREVEPGEKRLIAYVVPMSETQLTHRELSNFIAARLPEYMVPATFVKVNVLPLSQSGKVDRAALPTPDAGNTLRDGFMEPRTVIERRVAAILAELLHLDQVSGEDNFFLLGGHSLLGTQLIARIGDAFAVELSLRSLFGAPTVSKLSAQIEAILLTKLEAMSEDEAQRLLDTLGPRR